MTEEKLHNQYDIEEQFELLHKMRLFLNQQDEKYKPENILFILETCVDVYVKRLKKSNPP